MCIFDATLTILAGALSTIFGKSRSVNRNGPKWFVANVISRPSSESSFGEPTMPTKMYYIKNVGKR